MGVVFTCGCFDILHAGHVDFLRRCRELGDSLIVGLNSDASVRRLKGPSRPINNEEDRRAVLESLRFVDEVVVFKEDSPAKLIAERKPAVYVKGPGYRRDSLKSAAVVEGYGGRVVILDGPPISTTSILSKAGEQGTLFFDLDGTILRWHTNEWLPGAKEMLCRQAAAENRIIFMTYRGLQDDGKEWCVANAERVLSELPFDYTLLTHVPSPRILFDDNPVHAVKRHRNEPWS
jgi:rfaE bifunctional protein nucleotidyltransferase chain/domain